MSAGKDFAQGHRERANRARKAWPTLLHDPANILKHDDYRSQTDLTQEDPDCYICNDPEYAQMGLPLCYPCSQCAGHVPADDTVCTECGHDQRDDQNPEPAAGPARRRDEMTTSFPTLEAVPPSKPVEGWKVLGPVRDGSRRVYAAHLKESEARLIADAVNERHALRVELDRLEGALESVCLQLWKELRNRGADFPEYKNVAEARDLMRESTALKGGE